MARRASGSNQERLGSSLVRGGGGDRQSHTTGGAFYSVLKRDWPKLHPRITRPARNPLSPTGESRGRRLTLPPPTIPKKSTMHARRAPRGGSMGGVPPLLLLPRTVPLAIMARASRWTLRAASKPSGDRWRIRRDHLLERPVKETADERQGPQHMPAHWASKKLFWNARR